MADDKSVRRPPVFMDDDEVGDAVGAAGRQQLLELVVAAIQTLRVGNYQTKFL
jgi:hypothetical protein